MAKQPEQQIDESKTYRATITTNRGVIVADLHPDLAPNTVNNFVGEPVIAEYKLGAVAMANSGPNTNGSQFFICIDDCTRKLDKLYNLFGHVVSGIEVAQATEVGDVMKTVEIEERDAQ